MTVFQHGTKPTYNPLLPHTTIVTLRGICLGCYYNPTILTALESALQIKLSDQFDSVEFSCSDWAEALTPVTEDTENGVACLAVEALLHQALYGYKKYGTILQPNTPENETLDYKLEATLELVDFLNYTTNCILEGRDESVEELRDMLLFTLDVIDNMREVEVDE